ncbi:LysE family transporter [Rhodobacteraceae bacterium SC52]|nr:LysE family transporter [Rhodobacteraceae bacterium SC52]
MITFALAVLFLIITPGPGVLSAAGVGAGFGFRTGLRYVGGLFIGTNIVALCVVTGLSAVLLAVPTVRWILMGASLIYLIYLAARIAFAGSKIGFAATRSVPGIGAGILLQVINPKAYVVNTSLFTGFPFAPENLTLELITKALILNAIWIPIHLAWLWLGVSLNRLNLSAPTQRKINFAMAASLLAAVGLAVYAGTTHS